MSTPEILVSKFRKYIHTSISHLFRGHGSSHLTCPEPSLNLQVSEQLEKETFKTHLFYEWELCLGFHSVPLGTCFVHCSHSIIFGFQSTASQPIVLVYRCWVDGGRELAAKCYSLPPDSEGERGKKMSDEHLGK